MIKKKKTLYLVWGERNNQDGIITHANVGETTRTVEERLKDSDYARKRAGGQWVIGHRLKLPVGKSDHDVHRLLERDGYFRTPKTEEYEFNLSADILKKIIAGYRNELKYGVKRPNSYAVRVTQKTAVDQIVQYIKDGKIEEAFLLAALPRFGKSFVCLESIRVGYKSADVLFVTAKPDAFLSWKEELEQHVNYKGWNYYDSSHCSKTNPLAVDFNPGKFNLVFLSLQDSKGKELSKKKFKEKLNSVLSHKFDMLIVDEVHFGVDTKKTEQFLNKIHYDKRVDISGTAYRRLVSGEYEPRNIFVYGEFEETADVSRKVLTRLDAPERVLLTVDIEKQLVKELGEFYSFDEEGFKFSTLFVVGEDGKFVNELQVHKFFEILKPTIPRQFGGISPWHHVNPEYLNHMIWFLPPRVEIVEAVARLLRKTPAYIDYKIYVAAGNNDGAGSNGDILQQVKNDVKIKQKTIVLSGVKLSTGVTMPAWWSVFLMNDTDSLELYIQESLRCKTPDKNKRKCYTFDLNPNRSLEMRYQLAEHMSASSDGTVDEWLVKYNEVLPIMSLEGNTLVQFDVNQILEAFVDSQEARAFMRSWTNAGLINPYNLDKKTAAFLDSLEFSDRVCCNKSITISDQVPKGKACEKTRIGGKSKKSEKNELTKQAKKLLVLLQRVPAYLYLTELEINNWDVFRNITDGGLFRKVVGISQAAFCDLVTKGCYPQKRLDLLIRRFYITKQKMTSREIIDELYFSSTQSKTPKELVAKMHDQLPTGTWADKNKIIVDLACGRGPFLYDAVERFDKGLRNEIPNREQRIKHILENQVFGYDIDWLQCKIAEKLLRESFAKNLSNPVGQNGKLNVFNRDSLRENFDMMKFDVIVGNPPYQKGKKHDFYCEFVKKSLELVRSDGYILFVTPNRLFIPSSKLNKMLEEKKLVYVNWNVGEHFSDVDTFVCSWLIQNKSDDGTEVSVQTADKVFRVGRQSILPSSEDMDLSDLFLSISNKIFQENPKINFLKKRKTSQDLFLKRQWRRWNSITKKGGKHTFNPSDNEKDGRWVNFAGDRRNVIFYLCESKAIRYITSAFSGSMNVPPFLWGKIPRVDFKRPWSDQQLYKHFGLSVEEINHIEQKIK